ncbi:DMSO reductase maturation protein DsmD [Actinobacillus seminis]|uniref:Probable Tat proofreading chaperone DmsD n=1 Tax=Actinobacillus seminis TaxID=722 RepID=A0A263HCG6_9PAST|nr:Tat proofreading chaperone DmsD [Actinobacillus seminis]OZN24619.1 DMSO reductase maturation protein DsmD [Actinobacillus seminis]SUU38209.1 twin-argninine leader-binding protein DmsD [Actinobacillus seminis]
MSPQFQDHQWVSIGGRLLGSLFYYAPDSQAAQSVLSLFQHPNWMAQWKISEHTEDKTQQKITALIDQGLTQDLSADYQALFIGPNVLPVPPWGSVYLDPESVIFGNSLLELRDFLRYNAIEFSSSQDEPEDHFGLMLLLAAYLADHKPALLAEFFTKHLFTWANRYLDLLAKQQDYPFYQGLALLAQATLTQWQQQYAIIVPQVKWYR